MLLGLVGLWCFLRGTERIPGTECMRRCCNTALQDDNPIVFATVLPLIALSPLVLRGDGASLSVRSAVLRKRDREDSSNRMHENVLQHGFAR